MNNNKSTYTTYITHTKYNLHLNYHIILLNEANTHKRECTMLFTLQTFLTYNKNCLGQDLKKNKIK